MNSILSKHYLELEKQRESILKDLRGCPGEVINRSANGKWSISQIMSHVIMAEKLSVQYIQKKINAISEVSNTNLWNYIKLIVFIVSQRLPLKFKAPRNVVPNTNAFPDIQSMETEWNTVRGDLKSLLEGFSDDQINKKIYRHPILGRCSIVHGLIFFREHINHHYPQIKRQF